jgi:hypothetical protein
MTTIDLIDVFCCKSTIGIDPIDVFLTIDAQLCSLVSMMLMCKPSTTEHVFPIATTLVKFAIILEFLLASKTEDN